MTVIAGARGKVCLQVGLLQMMFRFENKPHGKE